VVEKSCKRCKGRGRIIKEYLYGFKGSVFKKCPKCKGSGYILGEGE